MTEQHGINSINMNPTQTEKDIAQMEELINTAVKSGIFANLQSAIIVSESWNRIKTLAIKAAQDEHK